jgi:DNA-binding NtrC family response regulator/tetratricopeptide (TPR) repeat protein
MARMSTITLTQVEGLLRTKKYAEAFDKLKTLDHSTLSGEGYGYYCILLSEAALHVGRYSEFCIDEAIEIFRGGDTEAFARAKHLKGWFMAYQGNFGEAKETLLEAYVHFLRCNNLSDAARVLNWLSFVTHHSGNVEAAIENLKKCLDIYDRLGDMVKMTKAAHNLAFVYFSCGRLSESLSTYSAYPVTVKDHGEKPVLNFYSMSAIPHALRGDLTTAKATIEKAKPYLDKYARDKAIYYENLGLISLLDNNFTAAEEALKHGLEISLGIAPESTLVSQIKRLLADLYVAAAKFDSAERFAAEALTLAEKINEGTEIAACWRIFAQIEGHRHNDDKAREWYKKAIDQFHRLGSQYELAVTRYLAATSGLYYNGERTALLYLAREYFESENVTHYTDKVNTQLRRVALPRKPVNKSGEASPTIIAVNSHMKKLIAFAEHIAASEMSVLLTGETGTGKDLLARYIHHCSGRPGEFVAVNASAIPVSMIESELFGCKQGAFTGASKDRAGLFEQADNGTFYLDEVCDASGELQAKLLQVLETRRVRRLGENKPRLVAFRLIAASNHDLHQRMRDNQFRRDLYHRLNEIHIELPPLRQRKDDIPHLVEHFLTFAGFDLTKNRSQRDIERLSKILSQRPWPGNIRQLRAEVRHLWLLSHGDISQMIDLAVESEITSEPEQLLEVLERTNWNRREAARILGVSEGTIRNRIKKYDLREELKIS